MLPVRNSIVHLPRLPLILATDITMSQIKRILNSTTVPIPSFVTLSVAELNGVLARHQNPVRSGQTLIMAIGKNARNNGIRVRRTPAKLVPALTAEAPGQTGCAETASDRALVLLFAHAAKPVFSRTISISRMAAIVAVIVLFPSPDAPRSSTSWSENRHARYSDRLIAASASPRLDKPTRSSDPNELANVSTFLAKRYRNELYQTEQIIQHAFDIARELHLDPWLILAVVCIESNMNPRAVSAKDARGLMQINARAHADKFTAHGGMEMAFHPETNIRIGAGLLRSLIDRFGSVPDALKAYVGAALLPHDEGYGAKVLAEQARIATAALGLPSYETGDTLLGKPVAKKSRKIAKPGIDQATGIGQPNPDVPR